MPCSILFRPQCINLCNYAAQQCTCSYQSGSFRMHTPCNTNIHIQSVNAYLVRFKHIIHSQILLLLTSEIDRWVRILITPWWRHQMETFSALLAFCAGNSPVSVEFPTQRPVTRSFDVFFHLCLNKLFSKQWRGWWFETPSRSLWRHCNASLTSRGYCPWVLTNSGPLTKLNMLSSFISKSPYNGENLHSQSIIYISKIKICLKACSVKKQI